MIESSTAVTVVVALCVVFVGVSVYNAAGGEGIAEYANESKEWCDERDGYLVNEQAFIDGGLYCHLENGTSVRMADTIEVTGE